MLENISTKDLFSNFDISWTNLVEKVDFKENKIFINENQFFGNVEKEVFDFFIGWYQPAQKWLKDRKNLILWNEEILHYIKIIFVISETIKIMKEIENIY